MTVDGGWLSGYSEKKRQAEILISRVVFVAVDNIRKRPSIVFKEITHETVAHRIDFFVRSWDRHRIEKIHLVSCKPLIYISRITWCDQIYLTRRSATYNGLLWGPIGGWENQTEIIDTGQNWPLYETVNLIRLGCPWEGIGFYVCCTGNNDHLGTWVSL